jgi:seryl-tRNA synthetase
MLLVSQIRDQIDVISDALQKRNFDARELLVQVVEADKNRRATQTVLDQTLAEANSLAKEIGILYKKGEPKKANILKEKTSQLKVKSKALQEDLNSHSEAIQNLLYQIPNIPNEQVPAGNSEEDNEEVFKEGSCSKTSSRSTSSLGIGKKIRHH